MKPFEFVHIRMKLVYTDALLILAKAFIEEINGFDWMQQYAADLFLVKKRFRAFDDYEKLVLDDEN